MSKEIEEIRSDYDNFCQFDRHDERIGLLLTHIEELEAVYKSTLHEMQFQEKRAEQAGESKRRLIRAIKGYPKHDQYGILYTIAKEEEGKG